MRADLAIWPTRVVGADNDLATANGRMAASIKGVPAFLARYGVDTTQLQRTDISVNDAMAAQYQSIRSPVNRFIVNQTLLLRSNQSDNVLTANQLVSELAAIGVVISSGNGEYGPVAGGPSFVYSGLNTLNPTMIADATARARETPAPHSAGSVWPIKGSSRSSRAIRRRGSRRSVRSRRWCGWW